MQQKELDPQKQYVHFPIPIYFLFKTVTSAGHAKIEKYIGNGNM